MGVPQGESGASALTRIRDYTNEKTLPSAPTVLSFLNKGVEEVTRRIGGIRLWKGYPTVVNQTILNLDDDVQDVVSANFSSGGTSNSGTAPIDPAMNNSTPFAQGSLVYPMVALEQASFMDAAAGFPAVGFGPPQAYFIFQDRGTAPSTTLDPPDAPQLSLVTGGSSGIEVEVVLTYVNDNGETTISDATAMTPDTDQQVQVATPKGVTNATGYNVYAGASGGPYSLQNASPIAIGWSYTIPDPLSATIGIPADNTATGSGTGGALSMQLYPAAMLGQVNVYYRARPLLWADTSVDSWTNLDTSAQEAAIIFAVMRVLAARTRSDEIGPWRNEYEALIADLKETTNRRVIPKSGQVRDMVGRTLTAAPWWL